LCRPCLDEHALLEADEVRETPAQLLTDVQRPARFPAVDLGAERRDRHDERALDERIAQLPEEMADQLRAWVRVMRGRGRYAHPVTFLVAPQRGAWPPGPVWLCAPCRSG
jgi:hypothetical protein